MILSLFLKFILLPLIVLILAGTMVFVKKKNELISHKTLIVFVLLGGLMLGLPGLLGIAGVDFSPWYYLLAQGIYTALGIWFVQLYSHYFGAQVKAWAPVFQGLLVALILALGGYIFALVFNLMSEAHTGGYTAATSLLSFPLPSLFYVTYLSFLRIPIEIYEVWHYPVGSAGISFEGLDFNRLMVLDLELSRQPADRDRMHIKAKAPAELPFGEWFKKFLDDYNYKYPNASITFMEDGGVANGWVFYAKPSFFHRRRFIDPALSVHDNKVREHITIIAKRVFEHREEVFRPTSSPLIPEMI